ncbi:TIGR00341 family protein [Spirosomataceae bacterium TFI 002]|nr:TIGR00341 family protein [Spirosomataceae bacterium TFI 002]
MSNILKEINKFRHEFFDLEQDRAGFSEIIEDIEKGTEFKGTNLWILIFAIMVASVGLNVNSPAVVIGAMLISPLMGPIMGIGLGLGTFDFQLIKKASKNLAIAVTISVLTSAIYFYLTPLYEAQSELLARTTPTIWDVLIAFFGGLAGIVAVTRKEKSNAIPGVAIATALMPPLCTAGYGLATGNFNYFFGAFYLFFINSVFISVSAFIIIRFLKIPYKTWVDVAQQKKMRNYVWIVVILTVLPSIYLGVGIVQNSIFKRNATNFIDQEFDFDESKVLESKLDAKAKTIEIYVYGEPLTKPQLVELNKDLGQYNLSDAKLIIRQNKENIQIDNLSEMKTGIIEDLYKKNEEVLQSKNEQIGFLEKELSRYKKYETIHDEISREIEAQYPQVTKCAMNEMIIHENNAPNDTLTLVYLSSKKRLSNSEIKKLNNWLKVRVKDENIKLIFE